MNHALSQVVFRLRKAASYNEGACLLQALTIENNDANNVFKTAGTLDLGTGNIIGTSTDGVLALMPGSSLLLTEDYQNVSSICFPPLRERILKPCLQLTTVNSVMSSRQVLHGPPVIEIFIR